MRDSSIRANLPIAPRSNRQPVAPRSKRLPIALVRAVRAATFVGALGLSALSPVTAGASTARKADGRGATGPTAMAARMIYLRESANLHETASSEATLSERGSGFGTFTAPLSAHLKLSPGHVSAVFTIYPKGGSITGRASASFIVRGSIGYYGGTLTITRGTGAYRRAAGSKIGISGTINRYSFALTVKANGPMRL